jgi:putative transcriptional regulator
MKKEYPTLRGQLLLDGGKLRGSFFHRTVVLICQHDAEGAFGLVLNRASENKVGEGLVADLPDTLKNEPIFLGGPVQTAALSYLHTDVLITEANVMANLQLGHSLDELVEIGESFSPSSQLRVFAGYAGWSPGQLDDEMRREAWLTHPASIELVFHPQPESLWKTILSKMGWQYRLLAEGPEDVSWN